MEIIELKGLCAAIDQVQSLHKKMIGEIVNKVKESKNERVFFKGDEKFHYGYDKLFLAYQEAYDDCLFCGMDEEDEGEYHSIKLITDFCVEELYNIYINLFEVSLPPLRDDDDSCFINGSCFDKHRD